jgi:hypothetical protein
MEAVHPTVAVSANYAALEDRTLKVAAVRTSDPTYLKPFHRKLLGVKSRADTDSFIRS